MLALPAIGFVLRVLGELLLGLSVLRVHGRVMHEHKLDRRVITAIARERSIGIAAVFCICVGAVLEFSGFVGS